MSNRFVNFGGIFLGFEVKKATGRSLIDVIKAYFIIEKVLKLEDIFIDIKDSDYIVSAEKQYQILQTIRESILTPSMIKFLNQNQNIQNINTEIIDIETEMKDVEVKNGL
jgi:NAD-specific glutamate dehydrogenase